MWFAIWWGLTVVIPRAAEWLPHSASMHVCLHQELASCTTSAAGPNSPKQQHKPDYIQAVSNALILSGLTPARCNGPRPPALTHFELFALLNACPCRLIRLTDQPALRGEVNNAVLLVDVQYAGGQGLANHCLLALLLLFPAHNSVSLQLLCEMKAQSKVAWYAVV